MTIIIFLLLLSILIFVHEAGHFWAARKAGIKVEEFGFGFPPRLWGKKIGETVYSINLLPIGGFVKLYGEEEAVAKEQARSFFYQSKSTRAKVLVAGVLMNFLLGFVAFSLLYSAMGIPVGKKEAVFVARVFENSPAEESGIKVYDKIASVQGAQVRAITDIQEKTKENAGQVLEIEVERGELTPLFGGVVERGERERIVLRAIPRPTPPEGEGPLGVGLVTLGVIETKTFPWYEMPVRGTAAGVTSSLSFAKLILMSVGQALGDLVFKGVVPKDVAGPVGIYQITGVIAQTGVLPIIEFLGILSVNLAVLNVLPIPALDGGRLLFIGIEALTKRRVSARFEQRAHQIGMALLLILLLAVTIQDVGRFASTGLLNLLRSVID